MPCLCDNKLLVNTNFEKLAIFLHSKLQKEYPSFYKDWDKEPDAFKWELRNQAKDILGFLNIKVDDF